ncbi:MAG: hypothetical protein GDA48_06470 [Hormoscilla sp. GM102CHS1]|nr:hypothetical protein [Hormoscilla sp. GM102CHS1]
MEDWQKDLFGLLEVVTSEVEKFFSEVTEEVTEFVDALAEISEEISEELQSEFSSELNEFEEFLNDIFEPIVVLYIEYDGELPFDVSGDIEEPYYPEGDTGDPVHNSHPACVGCCHYHGQVYGGNMFICAMHPYGWDSENCPDWQVTTSDRYPPNHGCFFVSN